jgi:predicted TIM-barrel fold metal-dependent hydrolase
MEMATSKARQGQGTPIADNLLISADSHVVEDPTLWKDRLPAALRDSAPSYPALSVGGPFQAHPGGHDPQERIKEMAADGVSGEVLYPSLAMDQYSLEDSRLQEACFRVYNDWIIEYCAVAPERLFGIGMISTYNIEHAVAELQRCKGAGLRGAMIWQAPPETLAFSTDHYEAFWSAAQDLQMPVNLHILTGAPYRPFPRSNGRRIAFQAMRNSTNMKLLYASNALSDIVLSGVLERHPRLRIVFVENEVSWIPFYLAQYDKYLSRGNLETSTTLAPSEYFRLQVYATFFNDPPAAWVLPHWGTDNCMWSNDYPHPNSTWPHSRAVIERDLGHLTAEQRTKLTRGNVTALYQLPVVSFLNTA